MNTKNKTITGHGIARDVGTMSVYEAMIASEYANMIVSGCESIDDLDAASDYDTAFDNCPAGFTLEQKQLAQQILVREFEKSIGRA